MMICPICSHSKFQKRSGRENARCTSCKAIERTRLLYMVLNKFEVLKPNIKILHIEPESSLIKIFTKLSPYSYFPFSVTPDNYDSRVYKLESPCDITKFPHQSFDLIIHNHLIEKIPFPIKYTLKTLSKTLKPTGYHFYTTNIEKGLSKEGLRELSSEERIREFGEINRFHKLGRNDFISLLQDLYDHENVYIKNEEIFSLKEYLDAALPEKIFNIITPSTIFCQLPKKLSKK